MYMKICIAQSTHTTTIGDMNWFATISNVKTMFLATHTSMHMGHIKNEHLYDGVRCNGCYFHGNMQTF